MGQCYTVYPDLSIVDEKEFVEKTREFIENKMTSGANFNLEHNGIKSLRRVRKPDTILKAIFPGYKFDSKLGYYWTAFDASYGWESVMMDWFEHVHSALGNDTRFELISDNDTHVGKIHISVSRNSDGNMTTTNTVIWENGVEALCNQDD